MDLICWQGADWSFQPSGEKTCGVAARFQWASGWKIPKLPTPQGLQGSFKTPSATAIPTPWKRNDTMFAAYTQDSEGKLFFTAGTGQGGEAGGRGGMFQTEKPRREGYLGYLGGARWPNCLRGRLWLNGSGITRNKAEGSFNSSLKFLESHKDRVSTAGSTHWAGKSWILRKFLPRPSFQSGEEEGTGSGVDPGLGRRNKNSRI